MLLIFDCDGVILDSMMLHSEVESASYRNAGINISPQELTRRFSGVPLNEQSAILESETGVKVPVDFEKMVDNLKEQFFAKSINAIPGIEDVVRTLADIPRCIASGSSLATLKHSLSLVDLYDQFAPDIYSSEQVARGKPAPDLFLYAAKQMGFVPADCLVIEDGVAGVQAAIAAGMRVFGFTGGSHCDDQQADRLKAEGAEIVFSEMRELPSLIDQFCKPILRKRK